jgi:hypothetical protein
MPKNKSVRRKDTKKKRKLARLKASRQARKPARKKRRELRGKSAIPALHLALRSKRTGSG